MEKLAFNPFLPSYEYIPDGEPRVFNGRVYLYGSHDRFNAQAFCLNDYVCWSAPETDLSSWRYEGVIYKRNQDPLNQSGKKAMYAPDAVRGPDGRYYLFYSLAMLGVISVAVCETPAGAYVFYGHVSYNDGVLLGKKKGDHFQFDPGVLVDTDGRVFLYSGFAPDNYLKYYIETIAPVSQSGMVIELEQDMKTIKKSPRPLIPGKRIEKGTDFENHGFFEASSMRKIDDTYYFIYSSHQGHELCYAVGDAPDGAFRFGGVLVSNGDLGLEGVSVLKNARNYTGNNHGSIAQINGDWYVFYHRQTNGHTFSRQACAEKLQLNAQGHFNQVGMTSYGLNGNALPGKGYYEARIACHLFSKKGTTFYYANYLKQKFTKHPYLTQQGEDRESCPDQYIANMREGATAGFKSFDCVDTKAIQIRVRGKGRGKMVVRDGINGEEVSQIEICVRKMSHEKPVDFESLIQIKTGIHDLYFTFVGKGFVDFIGFKLF